MEGLFGFVLFFFNSAVHGIPNKSHIKHYLVKLENYKDYTSESLELHSYKYRDHSRDI